MNPPNPGENIQPIQQIPDNEDVKILVNWKHVAWVGLEYVSLTYFIFALIMSLGLGPLIILILVFRGIPVLMFIIAVIIAYFAGLALSKKLIKYPYAISFASYLTIASVLSILNKLIVSKSVASISRSEISESATDLYMGLFLGFILIGGPLTFLIYAYVANRTKFPKFGLIAMTILAISLLLFSTQIKSKNEELLSKRVKDTEWAITPKYLPKGVIDGDGRADYVCKNSDVLNVYYECEYDLKYPGYLNMDSQKTIEPFANQYRLSKDYKNFFKVKVMKNSSELTVYKYKDNQCDLIGLSKVGETALINRNKEVKRTPAKTKRCTQIKTTGGKSLYYISPVEFYDGNYQASSIPVSYYFEQDNLIVKFDVVNSYGAIKEGSIVDIYVSDPNFQPELFKFVDSFSK